MIAALSAALLVEREVDPLNGIILAALAILALAPTKVFDLSFQLSFLAIWGLVALTPPLERLVSGGKGMLRWFLLLIFASAAAITATTVPVAYYFHRVSLMGLLSNLVVVPLMGYGAVVLGFLSLVCGLLFEPLGAQLLRVAAWLVKISDLVVNYLSLAPQWTGYRPGKLEFFLACLALATFSLLRNRRLRLGCTGVSVGALLFLAIPKPPEQSELRVIFLSVGQGDATVLQLPGGKTMLIDGGGSYDETGNGVGDRLLGPALWRLGVSRIDYLVLSHPHPDHIEGVMYVAAHLDVGEFWSGGGSREPEYQKLTWILAARGVPVRTVNAAVAPFVVSGLRVEPLWPKESTVAPEDENQSSLVMRLSYGRSSILFTGDLGGEAEDELVASGANLKATLLKVAHHGSKYSSSAAFLAAVAPQSAVISAGYGNVFRLPATVTVDRLNAAGVTLYRTDLKGSILCRCRADGGCDLTAPWGHFD